MVRVAGLSGSGLSAKQGNCYGDCATWLQAQGHNSGCCQVDTGSGGCFVRGSASPQGFWSSTAYATSVSAPSFTQRQWCGGEPSMVRVAGLSGSGLSAKQGNCYGDCATWLQAQGHNSGCCQVDTGSGGCFVRGSASPQGFWSSTAYATQI